ncbi:hypothetical protein ZYGM_001115 [Zygosaccharomyces mellis]|uniref:Thioredoxin domain-containing protein n=1 Tax=Zygosaccharomyces mellis TaxID=42258 RepID=A0A4C2EHS0_9SACH|nr:hypothetical protein ZYGM_001115 [Zygosaccharomyces mellis]
MSEAIDKFEDHLLQREKYGKPVDDEDAELDELLDGEDEFLVHYRERRVQEMSDHMKTVEKNVTQKEYGSLQRITDESALMQLASKSPSCVVHFGLDSFGKCKYMDEKLEILAERHLTTKFVRIEVEDCPFLVSKLKIKVLPFLVAYKNGKEVTRIVGFSKLGNDPNGFALESLEELLAQGKVVQSKSFAGSRKGEYDDSGSDLDL